MNKKKHHFVSQFYLRNWVNEKGQLSVWDSNKEKFFSSKPQNIACSNNFYRLTNLKDNQINYLNRQIQNLDSENYSGESSRILVQTILKILRNNADLLKFIKSLSLGEDSYKLIKDCCDSFCSNTFEDKFSNDEALFSPLLTKIIKANEHLKFNLKEYDTLIYFIVFQLHKTPKKIDTIFDKLSENADFIKDYEFNKDELYTFILLNVTCMMEKIYHVFMGNLSRINIYYNQTNVNFITSDDPSFNQKLNKNKMHIQIPISPKIMIEMTDNFMEGKDKKLKEFSEKKDVPESVDVTNILVSCHYDISEEQVIALNRKIDSNKQKYLYAQNREDIEPINNK